MGWFTRLLLGAKVRDDGRVNAADIDRAIEMAVEHTDPRLRMVSGHKRKLRKAAIRSLLYLNRMVERIPGPIEVQRKTYGSDPQVNALFSSADAMCDLFSRSDTVRKYLDANPASEAFYCTLGMFRREKGVFGMAMIKGMLRKDVAQVAVNFSGHWVGVAGNSLDEVKEMARWRGMESLGISALERIAAVRAKTRELQQQSALLQARLREFKAKGEGLEPVSEQEAALQEDQETIRRRLQDNARQLQEARASLGTLDGYLAQVNKVLAHPAHYLKVKPYSVAVNRMGIKVEAGRDSGGSKVVTAHIKRPRQPAFDLVLVRFPRAELRDEEYYRKRAGAYVHAMNVGH